jgi:hypothetical protein
VAGHPSVPGGHLGPNPNPNLNPNPNPDPNPNPNPNQVGISVVYAVLLLAARPALVQEKPTALSKALGFLVRDFDLNFMWWELLMAWRQLWLVGFAVLIVPGSNPTPSPSPSPSPSPNQVLIVPGSVEQLVISFLLEPSPNPNPNPNPNP